MFKKTRALKRVKIAPWLSRNSIYFFLAVMLTSSRHGLKLLRRQFSARPQKSRNVFDIGTEIKYHAKEPYIIASRAVGPFAMNQYFISCPIKNEAAIIDCGSPPERFLSLAQQHKTRIRHIIQTHAHIDHVAGLAETKRSLPNALIYLHPDDRPIYDAAEAMGLQFGIPGVETPPPPDCTLTESGPIHVGNITLHVIHTPGHCPGHVCLYDKEHEYLFSGDLLFRGSIGRTDLPLSQPQAMSQSLNRIMELLGDNVKVFPGHGEPTTIGYERSNIQMYDFDS